MILMIIKNELEHWCCGRRGMQLQINYDELEDLED
jgi:hypothetical protein